MTFPQNSLLLPTAMTKLLTVAPLLSALAFSVGCVIDSSDSPPRVQQTGVDPEPEPPPPPPPPPDPNQVDPAVVEIDPNRTMSAEGGQGLGVFVEYSTGGKWHLFWTCDTAISGQPCQFLIHVRATDGALTINDPERGSEAGEAFEFVSETRTEVHEAYVDATAGSDVQIEAVIDGQSESRFFFFVQDGRVNGDYTGVLTNPLIFRPKGGQ